eukprot:TRINITY_DN39204_c0_g1_i1.p1 TRINITY_DN39204_c0_g1~~TRINITY_DN39204_c0_g1_i1.p1  ORF type:complete len:424 (+),score=152.33 TRINITY_DN39204_c0_g1_i1:84-1274(+)
MAAAAEAEDRAGAQREEEDDSGGGWALTSCEATGAFAAAHRTHLVLVPGGGEAVTCALPGRAKAVRSLAFSADGKTLFVAGDDKAVEAWPVPELSSARHVSNAVSKKIGRLRVAPDGAVIAGDKAGDVWRFEYSPDSGFRESVFLLGHTASTITGLEFCGDSRLISSDKDEHIRVSRFPHCHVIDNYCLGHTGFIASIAITRSGAVASGSGDGTLRLWEPASGKELYHAAFRFRDESIPYPPTVMSVATAAGGGREWAIASVEAHGLRAACTPGDRWAEAKVVGGPENVPAVITVVGQELWCAFTGKEAPLLCGYSMKFGADAVELQPLGARGCPQLPFAEVTPSAWQLELERKRRLKGGDGTPADLKRRKLAAGSIEAAQRAHLEQHEREEQGRK